MQIRHQIFLSHVQTLSKRNFAGNNREFEKKIVKDSLKNIYNL